MSAFVYAIFAGLLGTASVINWRYWCRQGLSFNGFAAALSGTTALIALVLSIYGG